MPPTTLAAIVCAHPLQRQGGYDFDVPLLAGDHVTDDAGTGFVHTAPGHGREDFEVWTANARALEARGINTAIPYTVDENGAFTAQAPGFDGQARHQRQGREGRRQRGGDQGAGRGRHAHRARPAQASVSAFLALEEAGDLPQHAAMVHRHGQAASTEPATRCAPARSHAIKATRWVPPPGENRITGMIESRPDWVISRQRAWGVPIAVFVREKGDGSVEILQDDAGQRAHRRRLRGRRAPTPGTRPARASASSARCANEDWKKVDDILDVWFDSGSTHAFVLEDPSISRARRHQAQGRRRPRHGDVSRRLATSIAAGSTPRCWKAAARAAARRSTSC